MILGVLPAQLASSRMPGKALAPILGEAMICRQLERARRAGMLSKVVVATSSECADAPLADYLTAKRQAVFRGSASDLLDRCARAADAEPGASHVALLAPDSPLIDPAAIDAAVRLALDSGADYVGQGPGAPAGVEVLRASALRTAATEARDPGERGDPAAFVRNRPERFTHARPDARGRPEWAVEGPRDFAFARSVYEALYPRDPAFGTRDVLALIASRPEIARAA